LEKQLCNRTHMNNILIFSYLQRHFKKLIPIIKEFEKDKNVQLHVVLMTNEEKLLAEENWIKHQMLDEFTDRPRTYDFDLGWGLEPLINAIDQISPDLFIAVEVNYILRNAVRYCKQKKIQSLILQHGTPNKFSLHAFTPFEGDTFAAWGDFTKDYLVKNGVDENKIVITGGIPFDWTLSLKPDKEIIAKELGILPDKKWIIFTTQGMGAGGLPSEDEIAFGVKAAAKAILDYLDFQMIFQVHPSQNIEHIIKLVSEVEGQNTIVVKYKDTEELMAASEGVITFFSTTALDAVILKKPLMLINIEDDKDFLPFVGMQAAFGVYKKEDFAETFGEFLKNGNKFLPNLNKAADYVNFRNDGRALERVLELCRQKLA
jgi:UDP-N-acetylglucosamine 2-epimerase